MKRILKYSEIKIQYIFTGWLQKSEFQGEIKGSVKENFFRILNVAMFSLDLVLFKRPFTVFTKTFKIVLLWMRIIGEVVDWNLLKKIFFFYFRQREMPVSWFRASYTYLLTYLLIPWSRVHLEKLTSKLCS